jgi:WhiB family redox-sensing transcriptional regulator
MPDTPRTDQRTDARADWRADGRGDVAVEVAENWQDDANCLGVDPDLFFPERGASTREAKEVCRGCVVRDECLEFALQNGEKFGIWGGLSERERRRIRRQRAQSARSVIA